MKILLNITRGILIVLLFADLLFWLIAHGIGHIIPDKTNYSILAIALLLIVLILIITWSIRKITAKLAK
jgi:hypothetical protein